MWMESGSKWVNRFLVFGLTVLLLLAGCSDEDNPVTTDSGGDIPATSLPFPDTADQLMANFQAIYQSLDPVEYGLLLDPSFKTLLQEVTTDGFPHLGQDLDVAEETRIHDRLFSGEDLTDPFGQPLPPVLQFDFEVFRKIVDWGPSLPTDPIPNTLSALYEVEIRAIREGQYSSLLVQGQIRFYVATAEGRVGGEPKTYYRLVGQLDLTDNGKSVETIAWGSLKALYH
jgi:hypothetical protein